MTDPSPCPVCTQPAGFHDPVIHGAHVVPAHAIWRKAGELLPWKREKPTEPAHVKEDTAAILGVLKGLSEEDI